MRFRDKTVYVWGLGYHWDPSLSWITNHRSCTSSHPTCKYADKYDILWLICQCTECIFKWFEALVNLVAAGLIVVLHSYTISCLFMSSSKKWRYHLTLQPSTLNLVAACLRLHYWPIKQETFDTQGVYYVLQRFL